VSERYRIGEFELDATSGELRGGAAPEGTRLPPQPARLLVLLARKGGGLLTRDEIRRELWDGVEVEFEPSLHYCIRQVRAALGDRASSPVYVETLPRRGYRLVAPVTRLDPGPSSSPDDDGSSPPPRPGSSASGANPPSTAAPVGGRWRGRITIAVVALAAVGMALVGRPDPREARIRVGVMPFERTVPNDVAERIVERLTARGDVEVVGPTTTAAYVDAPSLRPFAMELGLAYLLNARFLAGDEVLAEIIRVEDGAHVWVARTAVADLGPALADSLVDALDARLRTGPGDDLDRR